MKSGIYETKKTVVYKQIFNRAEDAQAAYLNKLENLSKAGWTPEVLVTDDSIKRAGGILKFSTVKTNPRDDAQVHRSGDYALRMEEQMEIHREENNITWRTHIYYVPDFSPKGISLSAFFAPSETTQVIEPEEAEKIREYASVK